ncbi:MAG: hypothetical protein ACK4M7_06685, partial [Burkholderiales bacterium]
MLLSEFDQLLYAIRNNKVSKISLSSSGLGGYTHFDELVQALKINRSATSLDISKHNCDED